MPAPCAPGDVTSDRDVTSDSDITSDSRSPQPRLLIYIKPRRVGSRPNRNFSPHRTILAERKRRPEKPSAVDLSQPRYMSPP
jgi:hypothetical protein